mgnify:CR=1 FL=1|tara:strand:+ start:172 stop:1044 length:873 start_codon:yes stop_codon:yes gene_type:complete
MNPAARMDAKRLHVLVSFAYWNTRAAQDKLQQLPPEWNLMLDSGAFTNFTSGEEKITLDDYTEFCRNHQDRFWRIINLDKIGDPAQSEINLHELRRRGVDAIPVFQRGEKVEALARMAKDATPVCVGGISQNLGMREEQDYVASVMRASRQLGAKVHLLGGGRRELTKFRPFSGDNSTWVASPRFGRIDAWFGGKNHIITKQPIQKGRPCYIKPDLQRTRVLAAYDLTWDDILSVEAWKPTGVCHLANVRSWIRVARDLARADVRYVFASNMHSIRFLEKAWALEKHNWE